jgi:uncharacterized protein (TIGR00255 family)
MLKSMTGFGTGRSRAGDEEISVEVRAVNHKHLEVKARLPRELSALESSVLKAVRHRCVRGAVDVAVRRSTSTLSGAVPMVDAAMARAWREALRTVARAADIADTPTAAQIAGQPGVVRMEEPVTDLALAEAALEKALAEALDGLVAARIREGKALEADLSARLERVATLSSEVAEMAPRTVETYRARLQERVADLLEGAPVDEARLVQEVALFAERTDVAEEATRLQAHLAAFRGFLASSEPAGRKMDFLVQEMHREVNTTGSKSQSTEISTRIVELKAELERIREQVQNIE